MNKDLYYNPQKLFSYNRILNFVIGARGIGKSYSMKVYVVKRFLKTGAQFVYIRRYKEELKKFKSFFSDIQHEFPTVEFKVKGSELYINGRVAGWAIPLTAAQKEKSNAYPGVETIVFDEFMRQKDNVGYLKNDVESLLSLMDTIFRSRDNVRCVCLSNSTSITNPYFIYFDLVPNLNKRYNAYDDIVVEIPDSKEFAEQRQETRFGKLIKGTNYGDMSLDNEFTEDSSVHIAKRSSQSDHKFYLTYKGITMGIWVDIYQGILYASPDYNPTSKKHFAMTTDDHTENNLLALAWKDKYELVKLVRAFKAGALRYENQLMRNTCYEMFKKMRIY